MTADVQIPQNYLSNVKYREFPSASALKPPSTVRLMECRNIILWKSTPEVSLHHKLRDQTAISWQHIADITSPELIATQTAVRSNCLQISLSLAK